MRSGDDHPLDIYLINMLIVLISGLTYSSGMAPYLVMGSMGVVAAYMAFTDHETKGRKLSLPRISEGLRTCHQLNMGIAVVS